MIAYNGGIIDKFLIMQLGKYRPTGIFVTDTMQRATRYANAQATGEVSLDLNQQQEEGTVILHIECEPDFIRRPESHLSLDHCEDWIKDYQIVKATIRFDSNKNTRYGQRWIGYKTEDEVIEFFKSKNIEVELI